MEQKVKKCSHISLPVEVGERTVVMAAESGKLLMTSCVREILEVTRTEVMFKTVSGSVYVAPITVYNGDWWTIRAGGLIGKHPITNIRKVYSGGVVFDSDCWLVTGCCIIKEF